MRVHVGVHMQGHLGVLACVKPCKYMHVCHALFVSPYMSCPVCVTLQEEETLTRAALGQCTERDDFHFFDRWQQVVVMVATRCGHGGHGGNRLWSLVMVAAGCGHGCHGGSRLWSWWSWWQ